MVFGLLRDGWNAFVFHYKEGNMNWPMVIYLVLTHLAAVVGLSILHICKWQTLLLAFILWPITGLGITAGVHRLWAHRSYKANLPYRILLMIMNSIANQVRAPLLLIYVPPLPGSCSSARLCLDLLTMYAAVHGVCLVAGPDLPLGS